MDSVQQTELFAAVSKLQNNPHITFVWHLQVYVIDKKINNEIINNPHGLYHTWIKAREQVREKVREHAKRV